MKIIVVLVVLAIHHGIASAQVPAAPSMTTICPENTTITTLPVGTLYQFGTGSTWTPLKATTTTFPKLPFVASYTAFLPDPAPGVAKVFAVQQTAKAQTIIYTGTNGKPVTVVVPAIPPVKPPLIAPGTYTCSTVVVAADGTFTIDPKSCVVSK